MDSSTPAVPPSPPAPSSQQAHVIAEPRWGRWTPAVHTSGAFVTATVAWWLLADPQWAPVAFSQQAITAVLFWAILVTAFVGSVFGNTAFAAVRQPLAGVLRAGLTLAVAIMVVLAFGYAHSDGTFAASRADGLGFTAVAFIVLVGFYVFTLLTASLDGYPYEHEAGRQRGGGLALLTLGLLVTVAVFHLLIYPNFATTPSGTALLPLDLAFGWIYSSIVVVITAANAWDNWPWGGIGHRHLRALAALATTLGGGGLVLLALRALAVRLVPEGVASSAAFSANAEAANLGASIVLWGLIWGLFWGSPPHRFAPGFNRLLRTMTIIAAGLLTHVVFMNGLGVLLLHFPAPGGGGDAYGGNPMLWMNWVVLIVLWHAVAFELHGSARAARTGPQRAPGTLDDRAQQRH